MDEKELLVIAPDKDLYKLIGSLRGFLSMRFTLRFALHEEAGEMVARCPTPPRIVISRGITSDILQRRFQGLPILDIPILAGDILEMIVEARTYGKRIALLGFGPVHHLGQSLLPLLPPDTEVYLHKITSRAEIPKVIAGLENKGFIIAGHGSVAEEARRRGMTALNFHSRPETVLDVFREAEKMLAILHRADRAQSLNDAICGILGQKMFFVDKDALPPGGSESMGADASFVLSSQRVRAAVRENEPFIGLVRQKGRIVYCRTRPISPGADNQGSVVIIDHQPMPTPPRFRHAEEARHSFPDIIHASPAMQAAIEKALAMANSRSPLLLSGESGVGKEVLAQCIHGASASGAQPLVRVDCPFLGLRLKNGASAGREKPEAIFREVFAQARGGTLLLDRIEGLDPLLQLALLRFLEESMTPAGDEEALYARNIRLMTISELSPEELLASKAVTPGLFFRLAVLHLPVPPLRRRKEDIEMLACKFLREHCAAYGIDEIGLDSSAILELQRYPFPGNVRELRNIMERVAVDCLDMPGPRPCLEARHLRRLLDFHTPGAAQARGEENTLARLETRRIQEALAEAGGNRSRAARLLGISTTTLWRKLRQMSTCPGGAQGPA